jgi:hypothetical protein
MSKLTLEADSVISYQSIKSVAMFSTVNGPVHQECLPGDIFCLLFIHIVHLVSPPSDTYYEAECTQGPFVTVLSVTFQTLLQAEP